MIEQRYEEIESEVRTLAHSLPPSDFGSHRIIQAVAEFVYEKSLEAYRDGYNTAVLDSHALDAVNGAART